MQKCGKCNAEFEGYHACVTPTTTDSYLPIEEGWEKEYILTASELLEIWAGYSKEAIADIITTKFSKEFKVQYRKGEIRITKI